jgi:2Fe-2S ferredoxin
MPTISFVHPSGEVVKVDAAAGISVMRAALASLVPGIVGECGGDLVCATCHVFVDPVWIGKLDPASDDERDMLEVTTEEPTEYSRLSCQIRVTPDLDGLTVGVPRTQR